jgi:hypothetical protein
MTEPLLCCVDVDYRGDVAVAAVGSAAILVHLEPLQPSLF